MADIAFLLIIFFMVTAVFSATKGLDFKLPKDENQPPDAESEEAVFIKVAPDGSVTVDCKPMELEEILDYLEPKLTRNPEKPVILYTDAYAPYQAMISVYDVLGSRQGRATASRSRTSRCRRRARCRSTSSSSATTRSNPSASG